MFLIYNPAVSADKNFDIEVEYHFFRKNRAGEADLGRCGGRAGSPALAGERYVTRTKPQRFNAVILMGRHFDPAPGSRCWRVRASCCRVSGR